MNKLIGIIMSDKYDKKGKRSAEFRALDDIVNAGLGPCPPLKRRTTVITMPVGPVRLGLIRR